MKIKNLKILFLIFFTFMLTSCGGFKYSDARKNPTKASERAKKNLEEGKGVKIQNLVKRKGGTNYEFSTSNPLWRASLEVLDFMPLTSVNYSGGIIITDWYSDNNQNEALKITVRFLDNKIGANSLKIIVHEKKCASTNNCIVKELNSSIRAELNESILKRASVLEQELKAKKK